jgi:hypothetical protein
VAILPPAVMNNFFEARYEKKIQKKHAQYNIDIIPTVNLSIREALAHTTQVSFQACVCLILISLPGPV